MRLEINEEIKNKIIEENELSLHENDFYCFKFIPDNNKYNFYIFSYYCKGELELLANYEELNDILGYSFQSNLEIDIERWNMYLFCFIEDKISDDIKQLVEQNKYATRKIVFDNQIKKLDSSEIQRIIKKKLFELDIEFETQSSEKNSLMKKIEKKDKSLSNLLANLTEIQKLNKKEQKEQREYLIQNFMELKKHEFKNREN